MKRRKDKSKRVLKEGESQRKDGTYDFRWRTSDGKRHSVYAKYQGHTGCFGSCGHQHNHEHLC